jgi:hypothetical protein
MHAMIPRHYTADDLERIHLAAGTSGTFDAVSDFSPGPWWGFNGVLTLAIQDDSLYVVRQPFLQGGPGARLLRVIPVKDVEVVKRRLTKWFATDLITRIAVRGQRSMYLSTKYSEGVTFLDVLERKSSRNEGSTTPGA